MSINIQRNNKKRVVIVGGGATGVEICKFRSQGFMAWLLWLVAHLRSILGVKNKLMVMLNWLWNTLSVSPNE